MAIAVSTELKAEISGIIQAFLLDIGYEFPPLKPYSAVGDEVKLHFKHNGFSDEFISKIEPQIMPGVSIATTTFQTTPFNIQCTVAIFTTYSLIIDDFAHDPEFKRHLKQFNTCLLTRQPQGTPVLESMGKFLSSFHAIFGQFGGDMIIKDSLQFISACYLEAESENPQFPAEAHLFPSYFRLKVGVAEAYSFMLFPITQFSEAECLQYCFPLIPYLTWGFNWINDIMSFYKEVGETDNFNFVANSARCKGLSQIELLRKLCDDTSDVIRTLRTLGKAHLEVSKAVEAFVPGYVTYHLTQARYRMEDLDLTCVSNARE
ncbi:Trichodiene synthase [Penicillium cf. griseofulvum]|uniref:Trichodiene synthase n=1 Tax=Penicillium cf. griseofulvum TaxID=2972120 RepID=A0A9W9IUX7_9EURO|nr:Trichodiene synthase [Penicillium cf. griseofulvum]KAJ5429600.1 Trichodiene synthase [Penicillium cf. griseofulvum]KAJ5436634.1 Trichodiene synthase [Penicillium cf. griseofulvum]